MTVEQRQLECNIIQEITSVGSPFRAYHPESIASLGQHLQQYIETVRQLPDGAEQIAELWQKIARLPEGQEEIYGKILVEFELLEYTDNGFLTDQYLQQILQAEELGWRNQLYLSRQLQSLLFTNTVKSGKQTGQLQWEIYERAYDALGKEISSFWRENYERKCPGGFQWIPTSERQQGLVMVTTSQVLSEQHAPTKTALDRCVVLIRDMGMQVILVNTAEQGAEIGNILLFHRMQTNYKKKLSERDYITFHGVNVPFVQCSSHMPNAVEAAELVYFVITEKPAYIINIGGGSLVTDYLSQLVPVMSIATVPSGLATTKAQYQMIGRVPTEGDLKVLQSRGKGADHVISGQFTFALKEQVRTLSREQLGIPADRAAIVVVGGRLEREVSDDFIRMLLGTVHQGGFLVFVGKMDYDARTTRFPELQECSVYLGSQSDILAVMEQMDIYANPLRKGGGTSAVEAMARGVVPVTIAHGDVYVYIGDDFAVNDYAEMQAEILKLLADQRYYAKKSELAMEKASILMDSTTAFREVLEEFQAREQKHSSNREYL